ncbi:DUF4233 domain-containing protein [Microbacterium sp. STN6]|uniref:DUF4233 domain-containing protein n=1 Tax=Microbacterium sp. STN6 TaxID=2995588 RepID=UPI002260F128|nr:DUF4233 domain-containing protein [Microbacterium sp. STN6]MCX7522233.1 DUF4233 domain-containing protein [Microbacterium sp. STN6]
MRSAQRSLAQIVLGFELVVVFLGALVVFGLKAAPAAWALGGGAALIVVMAATIGLLRYRWAYVIGWLVQLAVIAGGILVPMLYIVGVIFTAIWTWCMITGARLDRQTPHPPNETETPA